MFVCLFGMPAPEFKKYHAVIFMQPQCQMRCLFCVTENNFDPLNFEDGSRLLNKLHRQGVRSVIFGGGEPFDGHTPVLELCRLAKSMGMHTQVGTNGLGLPQDYDKLDCVDRWVIPLESREPEPHDRMRPWTFSHHQHVLDILDKLGKSQKSVTVSTVCTQHNLSALSELACFLRDYQNKFQNIHAWHLYQLVEQGRGAGLNADLLRISKDDYQQCVTEMKALGLPFRVYKRSDMSRSREVGFYSMVRGKLVFGMGSQQTEVCA